jgi:hypothetical protein
MAIDGKYRADACTSSDAAVQQRDWCGVFGDQYQCAF